MSNAIRKVIFVVFSLRGGGAERVVAQLAESLRHDKKVVIAQLCDMEPFFKVPAGVTHYRFRGAERGLPRYYGLLRYLRRVFRRERADVTVAFGETISPFVVIAGLLAGQKVIVANRASPLSSLRGRRRWLNPLVFPMAEAVMVQTHRAVQILEKRFRGCQWLVLENPLEIPDSVPDDDGRANVCLTVGLLGGQKNQEAIIDAFAESAPEDWELWVAGDGPARSMLAARAEQRGVPDRVRFLGEVENVFELLMQARVFAFASRSEGFPNALAEAMACGCACIAYDCVSGPAELISHEQSGLLVPLDDPEAFNAGLKRLTTSPELRSTLAAGARERTRSLDRDAISRRFLDAVCAMRERTGRGATSPLPGRNQR